MSTTHYSYALCNFSWLFSLLHHWLIFLLLRHQGLHSSGVIWRGRAASRSSAPFPRFPWKGHTSPLHSASVFTVNSRGVLGDGAVTGELPAAGDVVDGHFCPPVMDQMLEWRTRNVNNFKRRQVVSDWQWELSWEPLGPTSRTIKETQKLLRGLSQVFTLIEAKFQRTLEHTFLNHATLFSSMIKDLWFNLQTRL